MSSPVVGLLAPADRAEIDDLLARYCFAIDRRDWAGLREVFAVDAVITYSGPRISAGINEIVALFRTTASGAAATQPATAARELVGWLDGGRGGCLRAKPEGRRSPTWTGERRPSGFARRQQTT